MDDAVKRLPLAIVITILTALLSTGAAFGQTKPEFHLGFKVLADQIPTVVGQPLEEEHWGANGDSLQQTTKGLMVWRKADNWTAFTNGSRTWVNGPHGVQERGNEERFEWESPAAGPNAPPSGQLRLHVIDVGQGDSLLLQSPEGRAALIDGGSANSGALQYLRSQGVLKLDAVILTHPHEDHVGGLSEVLGAIPVDRVYAGGQSTTTLAYERFLDAVAVSRAEYLDVRRGDSIQLGSLALEVLNPASNRPISNLNNSSVVLRFSHASTTFLLTGDAETDAEAAMLAQSAFPLKADVLKVGHHGSRTSSSAPFLSAVQPRVAIYSAAADNSYGHPHAEALANLAGVGATVYGTNTQGTVVVTADEGGYSIATGRSSPPRAPPLGQVPPALEALPVPTASAAESAPGGLELEVVSVSSPVRPGATATLRATTAPGADCTITVYYKSGPSSASGLVPKRADASGNVSWSWIVGTRTTPGTWSIVVSATKDGVTVTRQTSFTVG